MVALLQGIEGVSLVSDRKEAHMIETVDGSSSLEAMIHLISLNRRCKPFVVWCRHKLLNTLLSQVDLILSICTYLVWPPIGLLTPYWSYDGVRRTYLIRTPLALEKKLFSSWWLLSPVSRKGSASVPPFSLSHQCCIFQFIHQLGFVSSIIKSHCCSVTFFPIYLCFRIWSRDKPLIVVDYVMGCTYRRLRLSLILPPFTRALQLESPLAYKIWY